MKITARQELRTEPPEIPTDLETQRQVAYILAGASPDEFRTLAEEGGDSEYSEFLRWKHGDGFVGEQEAIQPAASEDAGIQSAPQRS